MTNNIEQITKVNKTYKGFTLIELLIMIVIIGFLGAISSVKLKDISSSARITSAINNIRSDIDMVKELALANHKNMSITFDISQDIYTIRQNGIIMQSYPGSQNGVINISTGTFSSIDITGVSLNNSNILNIDKWGNVLNEGTITINQNHTLHISGMNGRMETSHQ
tara:strand:+ start:1599 stop:2096 length:498 start_codon:yes stop_codon:yes gene_type:complete